MNRPQSKSDFFCSWSKRSRALITCSGFLSVPQRTSTKAAPTGCLLPCAVDYRQFPQQKQITANYLFSIFFFLEEFISCFIHCLHGREDWQKHSAEIKYNHISVAFHSLFPILWMFKCQLKYLRIFSSVLFIL